MKQAVMPASFMGSNQIASQTPGYFFFAAGLPLTGSGV